MGIFSTQYSELHGANRLLDIVNLEVVIKTIDKILPKINQYLETNTLYGERMTDVIDLRGKTVLVPTYDINNPPLYLGPETMPHNNFTSMYEIQVADSDKTQQLMNIQFLLETLEEWSKKILLYLNNKQLDVSKLANTLDFTNHIIYVATPPI
jgi:hypothetical protein